MSIHTALQSALALRLSRLRMGASPPPFSFCGTLSGRPSSRCAARPSSLSPCINALRSSHNSCEDDCVCNIPISHLWNSYLGIPRKCVNFRTYINISFFEISLLGEVAEWLRPLTSNIGRWIKSSPSRFIIPTNKSQLQLHYYCNGPTDND